MQSLFIVCDFFRGISGWISVHSWQNFSAENLHIGAGVRDAQHDIADRHRGGFALIDSLDISLAPAGGAAVFLIADQN